MARARRRRWLVGAAVLVLGAAACGGDADDAGPFELTTSPEFVNLVIPGRRPVALVTAESDDAGPIQLAGVASIDGATVDLVPSAIEPGAVAEVWVELPDVDREVPLQVTIDARRNVDVRAVTVDATAMPGTDDLEPIALDIAAVFLAELDGSVEMLPVTTDGLADGTPVGGLLVVSHYAWFTETAEIGLAWHIMVAPDDWAELTIRPRDELAPTQAFRLSSWSTALDGGEFSVTEIPPSPEVVR
ncbi:MAG: hypothetical protein ACLGHQ_12085 [Acidimicrobiia bacterium]